MPGSARKRGKTWTAYWRDNGKQRSRGGFSTKRAALDYASRQHAATVDGVALVQSDLTVREYLNNWLRGRHGLVPNTRETYQNAINRLDVTADEIRISAFRDFHLQEMINTMVDEEAGCYAPRTVHETVRLVKHVMKIAVHQHLVPVNPADSPAIDIPPIETGKVRILNLSEASAVFQALSTVNDGRYERLARFMIASQVRIGEALALTWADVDWDTQTIRVERSAGRRAGVVGDVKTPSSNRTVMLDRESMALLRRHKVIQDETYREEVVTQIAPRVFTGVRGGPMSVSWAARVFKSAGTSVGIPWLHSHLFRHTGASWLLAEGVPISVVSQRLGHANSAITMKLYVHAREEDDALAASAIGSILQRTEASR